MQQYLPFTVLKLAIYYCYFHNTTVATVLTVYGIETKKNVKKFNYQLKLQQYLPFTVLKHNCKRAKPFKYVYVATVLTVYGIETF